MAEGIIPKSTEESRPRDRERAHREHDDSRRNRRDRHRDAPRRTRDYAVAAFAHHLEPSHMHPQLERRYPDSRDNRRGMDGHREEVCD